MRTPLSPILLLMLCTAASGKDRAAVLGELQSRAGHALPGTADPKRPFRLPDGISLGDPLTPGVAVTIALANNAALEADLAAIGIAQADVKDATLMRNPSIQTLLPVGLKPFEFLLNWPIEELWQRKKRVLAAERSLDLLSTGLVQNGLNLIRDVQVAHADLWLAERRRGTLEESAALRERIAELTERRRKAGDATGLDVALALTDARSARELAARAQGDTQIALTRLRPLLGLRNDPRALTAALQEPVAIPGGLVDAAYAARPDLRAAELAIEAAAYRAKWQRSRIFTMVSPMLSIKETGTPLKARTGPGLQMELPIFNRNQGQIARADAEVQQAAWRYAALRDRVEGEVREASARFQQAAQSRRQLAEEVKPAMEQSIAQIEKAYRNGDASVLNVLETTRQRFDVLLRELDAQAAEARSRAELERSVGKKL